jgi:hypothetical protein
MAGESKLEQTVRKDARKKGWYYIKIMRASENGWPDRIFFRKGRLLFMEFKNPDEPWVLSEQQGLRRQELIDNGIEYHLVDNYEDACVILGI